MVFSLLGKLPNTYAFTKALGEAIVVDEMDNLPVLIVRPSVSKFFFFFFLLESIRFCLTNFYSCTNLEGTYTGVDG